MMQWVMAAMLVCGASVMASCANEDDPAGRQDGDPDVPGIILDTVIQAVEGDAVFSLSQRGTVSLTPQAETLFTPSPTGHCRYQQPGSAEWAA